MTAEEIKERPAEALTQSGWLREIAYQLAALNESIIKQQNRTEGAALIDSFGSRKRK